MTLDQPRGSTDVSVEFVDENYFLQKIKIFDLFYIPLKLRIVYWGFDFFIIINAIHVNSFSRFFLICRCLKSSILEIFVSSCFMDNMAKITVNSFECSMLRRFIVICLLPWRTERKLYTTSTTQFFPHSFHQAYKVHLIQDTDTYNS